jgi:hypothetical protein
VGCFKSWTTYFKHVIGEWIKVGHYVGI